MANLSSYVSLRGASELIETARSTIRSAADRSELDTTVLRCGTVLYGRKSLVQWRNDSTRRPGPKVKIKTKTKTKTKTKPRRKVSRLA